MTGFSSASLTGFFPKSVDTPFVVSVRSALTKVDPAVSTLWEQYQQRAAAVLLEKSIPTGRTEEWQYVSLVPLHEKKVVAEEARPVLARQIPHVHFCRLSEAVAGRGEAWGRELMARHMMDRPFADGDADTFQILNRALTSDPWVLWVDSGAQVADTIEVSWKAGAGALANGLLLVDLPSRCKVDLVERYGAGCDALIVETTLVLGESTHCEYMRIQDGDASSVVLTAPSVKVDRDAHCRVVQVSTGARVGREDLLVELIAEGAEAHLDGLYVARGQQTLDHHTSIRHCVGPTVSRQIYKGILSEESRGVFNGRVEIARGASGSNSSQLNKNLMLSRKAEIDTKPELRIDNDDVKAAHGATIGRLDPEHVFYLRSRGLSEGNAVDLLSRGFALDVLERVVSPELRRQGQEFLSVKLSGLSWEMA